jgi:cytochrome c-type biogenesis protein CcmH/NrfG
VIGSQHNPHDSWLGDSAAAQHSFAQAYQLDPLSPTAASDLAELLLEQTGDAILFRVARK